MSHAITLGSAQAKAQEALEEIARDFEVAIEAVSALYDEEMAKLTEQATIQQYLSIIALQKVRHRLVDDGHQLSGQP